MQKETGNGWASIIIAGVVFAIGYSVIEGEPPVMATSLQPGPFIILLLMKVAVDYVFSVINGNK